MLRLTRGEKKSESLRKSQNIMPMIPWKMIPWKTAVLVKNSLSLAGSYIIFLKTALD